MGATRNLTNEQLAEAVSNLPYPMRHKPVWIAITSYLAFEDKCQLSLVCRWLHHLFVLDKIREDLQNYSITTLQPYDENRDSPNLEMLDTRGKPLLLFLRNNQPTVTTHYDYAGGKLLSLCGDGRTHHYLLKNGQVNVRGASLEGSLGNGSWFNFRLNTIPHLQNIVQVYKILNQTYFINSAGNVYFAGTQMGKHFDLPEKVTMATIIPGLPPIMKILSGDTIIPYFLATNGDVWGATDNLGSTQYKPLITNANIVKSIKTRRKTKFFDVNGNIYVYDIYMQREGRKKISTKLQILLRQAINHFI